VGEFDQKAEERLTNNKKQRSEGEIRFDGEKKKRKKSQRSEGEIRFGGEKEQRKKRKSHGFCFLIKMNF